MITIDNIRLRRKMGKWFLAYKGYERAHTVLHHARGSKDWCMPEPRYFFRGMWRVVFVCQVCFCLAVLSFVFPKRVGCWLKIQQQ